MTRSTSILREAASVASSMRSASARAGPSRTPSVLPGQSTQGDQRDQQRQTSTGPNCIVLHEIPKTATQRDVRRALQETRVVKLDFPLSEITMPPPSFPRTSSLTKSVHVALPRGINTARAHALETIRKNPLFPDLTPVPRDGRHRPASNLGMRSQYNVASCYLGARDWVKGLLDSVPVPVADQHRGRDRDRRPKSERNPDSTESIGAEEGSTTGTGTGSKMSANEKYGARGWNADRTSVVAEVPDVDWCRDTRDKGKRVVIRGLPGQVDQRFVRMLGRDCGVEQGNGAREEGDDVKRLPPSAGSYVSTWVVTTNSVASACRLVRKLNREYYQRSRFGDRFLLRAEIAW